MKIVAFILALIIMLSVPLSAQAATPRILSITPGITYSGSTATCSVRILGNSTSEHIEATIRFWKGNRCLETWQTSGNGFVLFSGTANAIEGNTYQLTVDVTFDGETKPRVSFSKKYE